MPTRLVYALIDPNTHRVRYIGRSRQGLVRPLGHELHTHNTAIKAWVDDLVFCGAIYTTLILAEATTDEELYALEAYWIDLGVRLGWPLCNTQGTSSRNHALAKEPTDPETDYYKRSDSELSRAARNERKSLSGWRKDPEVRKILSSARLIPRKQPTPAADPLLDRWQTIKIIPKKDF